MKLSILSLAFFSCTATAFVPSLTGCSSSCLDMASKDMSRRDAFSHLSKAAITTSIVAFPSVASAAYTPKYDDMKQIYGLGVSLDRLKEKVSSEDQWEAALVGIRSFNKDSNFYTGYARNFISKTVKNNAEGDVRVGYIRQASSTIGSLQELLEGRQGLYGNDASKEAVARVEKSQALIGKFLAGSGVEEDKFTAYIAAHP